MSEKTRCPTCNQILRPLTKKAEDAIALMKSGVRMSAAARAAGISRQRLHQIIKRGKE